MIKIGEWLSSFAALMFLFFVVFNPPIGISNTMLIPLTSMLFLGMIFISAKKIRVSIRLILPLMGFLPFLFYVFISTLFRVLFSRNGALSALYIQNLKSIIFISGIVVTSSIVLLSWERWSRLLNAERVECVLIGVGALQFLFAMLALLIPSVHETFLNLSQHYVKSEVLMVAFQKFGHRTYSFSAYFGDIFAYITSYLSAITILKAISEKKALYAWISLAILFVHLLNARTGIVLFFSSLAVVYLCYRGHTFRLTGKGIATLLLLVVVGYVVFLTLPNFQRAWIMRGVSQTTDLVAGDTNSGVYSQILGKDVVFPKNLIFGMGCKPESAGFYAKDGSAIDSGYVQLFWRFGLMGVLLIAFGYLIFFAAIYRGTKSKKLKCQCLEFAGLVALYHFKTCPIGLHGASFVLFSYTLMRYYHELRRKKSEVFPWEYQRSFSAQIT